MHKQNLTVRQELGAHRVQKRLPATMSPNVMMRPWCQQVIVHMCYPELQRSAVGYSLIENPNGQPNEP